MPFCNAYYLVGGPGGDWAGPRGGGKGAFGVAGFRPSLFESMTSCGVGTDRRWLRNVVCKSGRACRTLEMGAPSPKRLRRQDDVALAEARRIVGDTRLALSILAPLAPP